MVLGVGGRTGLIAVSPVIRVPEAEREVARNLSLEDWTVLDMILKIRSAGLRKVVQVSKMFLR